MKIITNIIPGIKLANEALNIFKNIKAESSRFIDPFLLYFNYKERLKHIYLEDFTDECIKKHLSNTFQTPNVFVLAGESKIEDPKTGTIQHFYIIKLYIEHMNQGYIFSVPFSVDNNKTAFEDIKYAGSDDNVYLENKIPEGEGSSCNTIKMDPKLPYYHRAAFLIGHMDESRLWFDTEQMLTDMYCKLALDTNRNFELIFEISKFGKMTPEMQTTFDKYNDYFINVIAPYFQHIKGKLQLENTKLGQQKK